MNDHQDRAALPRPDRGFWVGRWVRPWRPSSSKQLPDGSIRITHHGSTRDDPRGGTRLGVPCATSRTDDPQELMAKAPPATTSVATSERARTTHATVGAELASVVTLHHGMSLNLRFPWRAHHGKRRFACIPW